MTWDVSSLLVLTISASSRNVTTSSEQFSASFCWPADTSCVEFTIQNISRGQAGPLVCSVLGPYGSKTANLSVQESGTVSITGGGLTVEKEQRVEFQCLTSGWYPQPTIGWSLNGQPADSSQYNSSSAAVGDTFNSTSVLTFQAVSSTTVECWATVLALSRPKASQVFLAVGPGPPDWTVLVALVVSIGGFALLVLFIYGIVFCYKRRIGKGTFHSQLVETSLCLDL
uniref:Ig-like domain-containing protein n=1 Tax=Tetraodon nigroviridis TaxID=99883 RepID=H3C523_TETNG